MTENRHDDVLSLTARLAWEVHRNGMRPESALAAVHSEIAAGRYTREVSPDEIQRAFDGALKNYQTGVWSQPVKPDQVDAVQEDPQDGRPSLTERFTSGLTAFTDAELEAAKQPHAHAFQDGDCGLFPIGEVTTAASPGREGKTRSFWAIAVSYVLGTKVAGLTPQPGRSALIYSAEDSRDQYARLGVASRSQLGAKDAAKVREGIIVPDLMAEGMEAFSTLVTVAERRPIESIAVDAVIQALKERMTQPLPPGLIIFETVSTLSEAEEDNTAFRVFIRVLRRIARELDVAVVLVHHTSQAATNNLPSLDISVSDIRGATSLVNNSRQCHMLVNLGSDDEPYSDNDARTMLRRMAAPNAHGRVTALICLDSSKGIDPPPIFLHWRPSAYGPVLYVVPPPHTIDGARWRKVHQMIRGERAEAREAKRDEAKAAKVAKAVEVVRRLDADGKQPTARAVSIAAGYNPGWAAPFLAMAIEDGDVVCMKERVPRTKGKTDVYRPANPLKGADDFNESAPQPLQGIPPNPLETVNESRNGVGGRSSGGTNPFQSPSDYSLVDPHRGAGYQLVESDVVDPDTSSDGVRPAICPRCDGEGCGYCQEARP